MIAQEKCSTAAAEANRQKGIQRRKALARYQERKAAGICAKCGSQPAEGGFATCLSCRAKNQASSSRYHAKQYQATSALGICTRCRDREAMPGRKICGVCSESFEGYRLAGVAKKRAAGVCVKCGGVRHGASFCRPCQLKYNAASARLTKRRRDEWRKAGLCTICGCPGRKGLTSCLPCAKRRSELRAIRVAKSAHQVAA